MEKRKKKKRVMSILGKVYVVLLFLFIYAPVFVMIAFSFNDSHANVVGIYNKILCKIV
jgi:ABC-type spermidine/putrescine transport system permease subunit II